MAAFSSDAMWAQIGGVLSLWLGVTVMFLFEAFEFLYTYLTNNYFCCKKRSPANEGGTIEAPSSEGAPESVTIEIESPQVADQTCM